MKIVLINTWLVALGILCFSGFTAADVPTSPRAERAIASVEKRLRQAIAAKGLCYGAPVFMRIFKQPGVLEVWLEGEGGRFVLFKTYEICHFSGDLGPKTQQGDRQSPEGFYFVTANSLNPWSRFHLSFNLGYPNAYDRAHGRTGSALMVHGNCVSIGCYAMTDRHINEIYALAAAALQQGQPYFRVHIFPFALSAEKLQTYREHPWHAFWVNLQEGYDYFETHGKPPNVELANGRYVFGS